MMTNEINNSGGSTSVGVKSVERLYDECSEESFKTFGAILQTQKPKSDEEYVDYLITSIGIEDGMKLLDAGCGFCGPSSYFAQRKDVTIDAVTVSQVQVDIAKRRLKELDIEDKVQVQKGDYHQLDKIFPENSYDIVFFLESFGHCVSPHEVISGAFKLLKPGGYLYIKDTFLAPTFTAEHYKIQQEMLKDLEKIYSYRIPSVQTVLSIVREFGFYISFVKQKGFNEDPEVIQDFEKLFGLTEVHAKAMKSPYPLFETLELKFQKMFKESGFRQKKMDTIEQTIKELVGIWQEAMVNRDIATCHELRADNYIETTPSGDAYTKEESLALLSSPSVVIESFDTGDIEVRHYENTAVAIFRSTTKCKFNETDFRGTFFYTIVFVNSDGRWQVLVSHASAIPYLAGQSVGTFTPTPVKQNSQMANRQTTTVNHQNPATIISMIPNRVKSWLKEKIKNAAKENVNPTPVQQGNNYLPYIPYKYGENSFLIPKSQNEKVETCDLGLPIPPTNLWLGYSASKEGYLSSGETHVKKMLEIVNASDFSFNKGDRILDLGCGAGRMIRHLKSLSETCEIWGTDINAESIFWCKHNLSPPFNFAVTTKIPHLPFADNSLKFIYCGSLFTHIDDLVETWLLELNRVLAPDGRIYITIHDNNTMELFDGKYSFYGGVKWMKSHEIYQEAKGNLRMLSIGRDSDSQVFYDIDYFCKTLNQMFEIISVTQEAYFFQTAILLKIKAVI